MLSVYQRVYQLVDILQVEKNNLANTLQVSIQNLNSMAHKTEGGPSAGTLVNLFAAFPQVNERWVLLNEGTPLKPLQGMFQEPEIKYSTEAKELLRILKTDKEAFNLLDMVIKIDDVFTQIRNLEWRINKLEKLSNTKNQ